MAENENVEPTPQSEEQPTPQFSGEQGGQSSGQADVSADVLSEVKEIVRRELQSFKDVRLGKHETRLESLEDAISQFTALTESGMSKDEALGKMRGEQELAEIKRELAALKGDGTSVSEGSGTKGWAERQATILDAAGIDPNDMRIGELMKSRTFENEDDYIKALESATFEWKMADANKPKPTSSTIAQTVPGAIPQTGDFKDKSDDALGAEIIELSKNYRANAEVIERMNAELARRAKLEK
jgi:hypothetical protein